VRLEEHGSRVLIRRPMNALEEHGQLFGPAVEADDLRSDLLEGGEAERHICTCSWRCTGMTSSADGTGRAAKNAP
jgi:hypothetical protein